MILLRRYLAGGIPYRPLSLKRLDHQPISLPGELTTKSERKKRPDSGWCVTALLAGEEDVYWDRHNRKLGQRTARA
jgi:hypothetical protein